jgi:hypothetical protein
MNVGGSCAWDESRHPEWDLMYCKGLTAGQIAELCGVKGNSVSRHLRAQKTTYPKMQAEHDGNRPPANPRPLLASWNANLDALSAIQQTEGRYPSSSDSDPGRRRLGSWLSVQRRAHRNGKLSEVKLEALTALPGWTVNQRKELDSRRWRTTLRDLQVYVAQSNRWPRYRKYSSDAERLLGVWLHGQRQKSAQRTLSDSRNEMLDAAVPGWNTWKTRRKPDGNGKP